MDWVEKTVAPSGRGGSQIVSAPKDFYTLDSPGFIFSVPAVVIEEMFVRSLFGLPANMKVTSQQNVLFIKQLKHSPVRLQLNFPPCVP